MMKPNAKLIAAKDLEVGDDIFVGGKIPAFQWEIVRSITPCQVPVRLEGGSETTAPGRTVRYGPMSLGLTMLIDEEAVFASKKDPELTLPRKHSPKP